MPDVPFGGVDGLFADPTGVVTTTDGIVHAASANYVSGKKSPRCDALDIQYVWQETGVITCIDCLAYDPEDWTRTSPAYPMHRVNPRREYKWDFVIRYEDKKKGDGDG